MAIHYEPHTGLHRGGYLSAKMLFIILRKYFYIKICRRIFNLNLYLQNYLNLLYAHLISRFLSDVGFARILSSDSKGANKRKFLINSWFEMKFFSCWMLSEIQPINKKSLITNKTFFWKKCVLYTLHSEWVILLGEIH